MSHPLEQTGQAKELTAAETEVIQKRETSEAHNSWWTVHSNYACGSAIWWICALHCADSEWYVDRVACGHMADTA